MVTCLLINAYRVVASTDVIDDTGSTQEAHYETRYTSENLDTAVRPQYYQKSMKKQGYTNVNTLIYQKSVVKCALAVPRDHPAAH